MLLAVYCLKNLYGSAETEQKLVIASKMVKVIANDLLHLSLFITSNPIITLLLTTYITNPSNRYLLAVLFLVVVVVSVRSSQHTDTDQNNPQHNVQYFVSPPPSRSDSPEPGGEVFKTEHSIPENESNSEVVVLLIACQWLNYMSNFFVATIFTIFLKVL